MGWGNYQRVPQGGGCDRAQPSDFPAEAGGILSIRNFLSRPLLLVLLSQFVGEVIPIADYELGITNSHFCNGQSGGIDSAGHVLNRV